MNTTKEPFTPFPKLARLQREVIIDLKARLEYFQKRTEKAEDALIDLKLFGKTQPHENI